MTSPIATIAPSTPPSFNISSNHTSTPIRSQASSRFTKGKHKATDAEVEVMRLYSDLAKVNIILDELLGESLGSFRDTR
jgi:hypothetical protein